MRALLLFWALLCAPALAWNARGHRIIAALAWEHMGFAVAEWVEEVLAQHPDPTARSREGASTWPDRLRESWPESQGWHFINLPIVLPGYSQQPPAPPEHDQVIWALGHWQKIAVMTGDESQRAQAVAFLIHLVGDIHQPLHAACGYGPQTPQGDKGGHHCKLVGSWSPNLHHFWDCGGYPPELNDDELLQLVSPEPMGPDVHHLDFERWARESHQLASQHAYPAPLDPSGEYALRTQHISRQRMNQAGLRLAYVLRRLAQGN